MGEQTLKILYYILSSNSVHPNANTKYTWYTYSGGCYTSNIYLTDNIIIQIGLDPTRWQTWSIDYQINIYKVPLTNPSKTKMPI